MHGKDIKNQLRSLIEEASAIDPNLAKRLEDINRWIRDVKPGSLTAKKFVIAFLLEVIRDSTVWLKIQALASEEEKQAEYDRMTPTESYWYGFLFPKWINETDAKFSIWKQKLMAGEFGRNDDEVLQLISGNIVRRGGSFWQRYIADLSMATDLIVSNRQEKPLCVQVTTLSGDFAQQKYNKWVNTLQDWQVKRGLFLSFNPATPDFLNQLVNMSLYNSDHLTQEKYLKFP